MPTPTYGMAKTVRQEFEQAEISNLLHKISYAHDSAYLEYYGITTAVTANQELFINGKGNVLNNLGQVVPNSAKRLYVGESCSISFQFAYHAHDTTTNTCILSGTGFVSVSRPTNGNVVLSTASTGVAGALNTKLTNPSFTVSVGDASLAPIILTADVANQCMRVALTPFTANRTVWMVQFRPVFAVSDRALFGYFGDRGAGDSLEA